MNATSLYVSTCRLILQAKVDDTSSWLDLYKLFPCLRQSLSCTVCGHLLIEPYTPTETNCQHHVCRSCKGGRKKLKPSCSWCKDYGKYVENVQLRTLLQCYKKLCQYVTSSEIYRTLNPPSTDNTRSLVEIIKEGAGFKDDFNAPNDLFMVPCSYTSASTQTGQDGGGGGEALAGSRVNGGGASPVYSVYAAGGNRLTIKRTPTDSEDGDRVENGLSKVSITTPWSAVEESL
ncbi:hypothetical protein AAG570_006027 [Ranatra chinensis]|uniref:RING-type domain-containing protein n=1 Tax=Ranatra chinensis TaxID=642074 RepID=A0ABD0XXX5_9HEMI